MKNSKILCSAFGAAIAATMALSTPAMALEGRQCLPIAEMNAALRAEGQRTLILGDRSAVDNPTGRMRDADVLYYANAVTSNSDGSVGYQLEGDLPRAQPSTRMCVAAKITNIQLLDARQTGPQQQALLGGAFDAGVRDLASRGTRAMLVADTLHSTAEGERIGLPLVVFGNSSSGSGSLYTRLPDGRAQMLAVMHDTEYTPVALQRLSGARQVAFRDPN